MLVLGYTRKPWVRERDQPVQVAIRRVAYDVASMAAAVRAAEGLPDHFAANIERGGAS